MRMARGEVLLTHHVSVRFFSCAQSKRRRPIAIRDMSDAEETEERVKIDPTVPVLDAKTGAVVKKLVVRTTETHKMEPLPQSGESKEKAPLGVKLFGEREHPSLPRAQHSASRAGPAQTRPTSPRVCWSSRRAP
jgi:hypothetical protein